MKRGLIVSAAFMLGLAFLVDGGVQGGDKKDPKYSVKEVMQKAMKGGLFNKVSSGKATKEEKELLVELFVALHTHKAPKNGDQETWEKTTKAILDAAKSGDEKALKKAVNCAGCHKLYKG